MITATDSTIAAAAGRMIDAANGAMTEGELLDLDDLHTAIIEAAERALLDGPDLDRGNVVLTVGEVAIDAIMDVIAERVGNAVDATVDAMLYEADKDGRC